MTTQAKSFIAIMRSFSGYLEKETNAQLTNFAANAGDENFTLFGKWYDDFFHTKGFNGEAWCHDFVSGCACFAGISQKIVPYTASCATGVSWFKQRGRWHDRNGYTPQPADFIYFTKDGKTPVHVGGVSGVINGMVYTVEGNTGPQKKPNDLEPNGGGVWEKSYPLNSAKILGYGSPAYVDDGFTGIAKTACDKIGSSSFAFWSGVMNGKYEVSAEFARGLFKLIGKKSGKTLIDDALFKYVDELLDLSADDLWKDVLTGKQTATADYWLALFGKIVARVY